MKTYLINTVVVILFFVAGYLVHANIAQGNEFKSHLTVNTGEVKAVSYLNSDESIVWMTGDLTDLEIRYDNEPVFIETIDPLETREGPTWAVYIRY